MKKYFIYFFWQLFLFLFLISVPSANPQSEINSIGSFEQDLPSYWTKGNEPSGTTLSWATDRIQVNGEITKDRKDRNRRLSIMGIREYGRFVVTKTL